MAMSARPSVSASSVPPENRLDQFDACVGMLPTELGEAFEQQPGGEDGVHGKAYLRLEAAGEFSRGPLEATRLIHQRLAAAVEHLARWRQHGLAAPDLEDPYLQQVLEFLDGVGDRRLGAVQAFRRLRIAAGLNHGHQRVPLIQRDFG